MSGERQIPTRLGIRHAALPLLAIGVLAAVSLFGVWSARRTQRLETRMLRDVAELAAWAYAYRGSAQVTSAHGAPADSVLGAVFDTRVALLPETMTGIGNNRDLAHVTVVNAGGDTLFASTPVYAPEFSATVDFGRRGNGTVTLALSPAAAHGMLRGAVPGRAAALQLGASLLALVLAVAIAITLRRAQRLARLRSDFAAAVTHELRTPLTQILLNAETLALDRTRSATERREFSGAIVREARRLVQLIDNVLHFSRAERRLLVVHPRRERVDAVVTRVVEERSTPLATRVALSADAPLWAIIDPDALSLAIGNVVDNALRHGDAPVRVSVTADASDVLIVVSDNGPGIAPRDRRRALQPFVRLAPAQDRHPSGSGIGLAVVAEAVHAMGGRVTLGDAEPKGLRVQISFPRAEQAA